MLRLPQINQRRGSSVSENNTMENSAYIIKNNLSIAEAKRDQWEISRQQRLLDEQRELEGRQAAANVSRVLRHHRDSSRNSQRSRSRAKDEIQLISNGMDSLNTTISNFKSQQKHLDEVCADAYAKNLGRADFDEFSFTTRSSSAKGSPKNRFG